MWKAPLKEIKTVHLRTSCPKFEKNKLYVIKNAVSVYISSLFITSFSYAKSRNSEGQSYKQKSQSE